MRDSTRIPNTKWGLRVHWRWQRPDPVPAVTSITITVQVSGGITDPRVLHALGTLGVELPAAIGMALPVQGSVIDVTPEQAG
jgi:hypothetical protein